MSKIGAKIGDSAEFSVEVTADMVDAFAKLSGDMNALHMDEKFAQSKKFEGRVAHGMLGASFFSRLVGMHLPGKNSLYLSQSLFFRRPIYIGMKVTVKGVVMQTTTATRTVKIKTEILNSANAECLLDGEALVKVLE